jgi:hypothetical protein
MPHLRKATEKMTRREATLLLFKLRDIRFGSFDLSIPKAVDLILESFNRDQNAISFSAEEIEAASQDYNVRLREETPSRSSIWRRSCSESSCGMRS